MARLKQETKDKILAEFHIGKSQNWLATKYECSPATVNKICKGVECQHKHKYKHYIDKPFSSSKDGFLYVLYFKDSANSPYYKIGLAKDVKNRIKQHQTSSPFKIYIAICYYVEDMREEEKVLHTQFEESRILGEWFKLNEEDLMKIKERSLRIFTDGI